MKINIKLIAASILAGFIGALGLPLVAMAATTETVTPTNAQGWTFNPDLANATPYEFSEDKFSIGEGSLYVEPIGTTPEHKFIAEKTLGTPVSEISSVSYDYLIAGNGDAADANQFYLNVYTNFGESSPTKFYDCRYDVVATVGSTAEFTTVTFDPTQTYPVTTRGDSPHVCPASPSEMQALSATGTAVIRAFSVNVGDTSANDVGLAGYLDNGVVTANTAAGTTTYDFEQDPKILTSKDQCKNDGWKTSEVREYKNQGDCVSSFASKNKSDGNSIANFFRDIF